MPIFREGPDPHALTLAMTAVQMGDRVLQIGCSDRSLVATLASKVGLSGQAVIVVFAEADAERARKAARDAGVLVDVTTERPSAFGFDLAAFDLAVVDSTGGLLASMRPEDRVRCLQEVYRVLRPAGRAIVIEAGERGGLGSLFARASTDAPYRSSGGAVTALQAEGFKSVRVLAEREGRRFIEGIKPRTVEP